MSIKTPVLSNVYKYKTFAPVYRPLDAAVVSHRLGALGRPTAFCPCTCKVEQHVRSSTYECEENPDTSSGEWKYCFSHVVLDITEHVKIELEQGGVS